VHRAANSSGSASERVWPNADLASRKSLICWAIFPARSSRSAFRASSCSERDTLVLHFVPREPSDSQRHLSISPANTEVRTVAFAAELTLFRGAQRHVQGGLEEPRL